jgi:glucan-binding YG repeat protein
MLTIKQHLDNDDHYVGSNIPTHIVMHGTGNKTDSAEGNVNYFCGGSRKSSAHYFVDDNDIEQLVLDRDGAWHCGDGYNKHGINNRNSIGIEMCQKDYQITEATMKNTAELVRQKMIQYNIPIERVVRHYDASGKMCPEALSKNNWALWHHFIELVQNGSKNGWYLIQGKWYYFVNNRTAINSWARDSYGEWFYLGYDGVMVTNGWAKDSNDDWFYLGSDGRIVKNQWVHYTPRGEKTEHQYYMGTSGAMLTNAVTPDGYKVLSDGSWDGNPCQ